MESHKIPYICGPLTELPVEQQESVKSFYKRIADLCEEQIGERAFVPHEHFDPVRHLNFLPKDVDKAERKQVCERTSLLIVVAIAPSWGGGIEVEMANRSSVPVVILCERQKNISRLLRGNPSVIDIIFYTSQENALLDLRKKLVLYEKIAVSLPTSEISDEFDSRFRLSGHSH